MNKLGELTTFHRLMNKEAAIIIPKVQRDYAYGRDEEKVKEILSGLLDEMFEAVRDDKKKIFDFVYGGSYVRDNDNLGSGLIPLDGQQRLTTLFLIHFVASIIQKGVTKEEVEWLKKFRYETRQSATDFCDALIGEIRDSIIKKYPESRLSIREIITDHPRYLSIYSTDPTISSMLNVIDEIERMLADNPINDMWTKLVSKDNILFYSLTLEKFGLSDDLYIKMNARGKKLTEFEIFKNDFEKAVKNISDKLKDDISIKIDNAWMDIVWHYAQNCNCEKDDIVTVADEGYMRLFRNIMRLELFRRGIESKDNRSATINEIITDEDSIKQIMHYFDTFSKIDKANVSEGQGGGIENNWYNTFYFSNDVIGRADKIRLFWADKKRKPVIYLAIDGELTVPELTWLYAIYLSETSTLSEEDRKRCLRIVRNLLTANVRAHSQRYDMLKGFLDDVAQIFNNNGPVEGTHKFVGTAYDEELIKAKRFNRKDYDNLLIFENHSILEGSLMLFIDKYGPGNIRDSSEPLFESLSHFSTVFNDSTYSNFDLLRVNFVSSKHRDWMQYETSMIDNDDKRYYLIHRKDDFSKFFIKNKDRYNQPVILDILAKELISAKDLIPADIKCKEFNIYDWQYYFIKYKGSNIQYTTYGIFAWEDIEKRPLEAIILNSSYHSRDNIEWKMLNHALITELGDNNPDYSLDNHGSAAVVLNNCNTSFTISQQGWIVESKNPDLMAEIASDLINDNSPYNLSLQKDEEGRSIWIASIDESSENDDYIQIAINLINRIEQAYEKLQPGLEMKEEHI